MDNNQPIIVKRVKKNAGGHHGGAWKIAFADFAMAMMAFFLVMWLMTSATPEQKKAISGYFQDPIGFTESASPYVIDLGGTPTPAPDRTLNPELKDSPDSEEAAIDQHNDQAGIDKSTVEELAEQVERERLELLMRELQAKIDENPELREYKDQIKFEITQDGLRIQIMDAENRPMFDLGSARLQPYFEDILLILAETINSVPNKISLSGHTDAKPFSGRGGYGNWELSADRANAARRALIAGGYADDQVARVVGYASSALFERAQPFNPINRRIDIIVLTKRAQKAIEREQDAGAGDPAAKAEVQAAPTPEQPLEQRLNIFEDGVLDFNQTRE